MERARRLERFFTQPFFTTEAFTGLSGKLVSLENALQGCERILADELEDLPESAFYMIGTVDEAHEKNKQKTNSFKDEVGKNSGEKEYVLTGNAA